MLLNIDAEIMTEMPHKKDYEAWRKHLSDEDHRAIIEEIHNRIAGTSVNVSSWIPGTDWTDTPFEAIYTACGNNYEASAKFFGLLTWEAFMEHEEAWVFVKGDYDDPRLRGMIYFKPPETK